MLLMKSYKTYCDSHSAESQASKRLEKSSQKTNYLCNSISLSLCDGAQPSKAVGELGTGVP